MSVIFRGICVIMLLVGCKLYSPDPIIFLNSHPSDYLYLVEDAGRNKYYTNDFKQVSSVCITFTAQDSSLKKICGDYSITLLKY